MANLTWAAVGLLIALAAIAGAIVIDIAHRRGKTECPNCGTWHNKLICPVCRYRLD